MSLTSLQDAELISRVADGDPVAFQALSERHINPLLALSARLLGDRSEAEDMVQECFLRVWRHAGRWKPTAAVGTWMHRITYNLCIDRIRARKPTVPIEPLDPPSQDKPADQRIQDQDIARRVGIALATLPDRQRSAIVLVHYQELPARDAANTMEISVEALESLLSRGRRGLRAALLEEATDLIGVNA
ncbi:MAG: RNA polymerase sigma factor [Proteobacteria bacterium]|nr:RNA polymerase sigma factor [Pseudomonadota bacterium]MDA1309729.1 RNA polymerase sigma factor [Pseudomonadota bacterium]